jgi:hypothetical protein
MTWAANSLVFCTTSVFLESKNTFKIPAVAYNGDSPKNANNFTTARKIKTIFTSNLGPM